MAAHLLNVPYQLQSDDGWCLPACVAMVTAYWEEPLYQADVARWLDTETEVGTLASHVLRLSRYGFDVTYQEGPVADLEYWLGQNVPVILFLRTGELPYWTIDTPHAVVLAGLDVENAYLFDPDYEPAPVRVSIGDLMLAWSYSDYSYAIIRPTA